MKKYIVSNATPHDLASHLMGYERGEVFVGWGSFPVLGKFRTKREAVAFGNSRLGFGWSVLKRTSQNVVHLVKLD